MRKAVLLIFVMIFVAATSVVTAQTKSKVKQTVEQKPVAAGQSAASESKGEQGTNEEKKEGKDKKMCPCMKMMMKQGRMTSETMKEMQQSMGQMGNMIMQNNMLMMMQMLQQQQRQIDDLRQRLDAMEKKEK